MTIEQATKQMKEAFAAQMEDLMKLSGLNGNQLAIRLHCDPSVVWAWRHGERFPSGPSLLALADELGVTVELLTFGREC